MCPHKMRLKCVWFMSVRFLQFGLLKKKNTHAFLLRQQNGNVRNLETCRLHIQSYYEPNQHPFENVSHLSCHWFIENWLFISCRIAKRKGNLKSKNPFRQCVSTRNTTHWKAYRNNQESNEDLLVLKRA